MNRIKIILLIVSTLLITACATSKTQADKEKRATQKAEEEMYEMALFEQAVEALENKDFVLEAERIQFRKGQVVYVTSTTNFVSVKDDKATIQLALSNTRQGANGLGGITLDGHTSKVEMKTDKKGNVLYSMFVMGTGLSARVELRLVKGTNKCTVTVTPNFNNHRTIFTGVLLPSEESKVFKGRALF